MSGLAVLALLAWVWLLVGHGRFWQAGPVLDPAPAGTLADAPPVVVVVPARDEATHVAACLGSLLTQDYSGPLRVVLVDDGSRDGTGAIARGIADPRLQVLTGAPRPAGWSGKLWAVAQGIDTAADAELILLTDADIVHDRRHLTALVAKAERDGLDLVSEMVALACDSPAERALVPAFVFFFQLLYPFVWVNDPLRATAAAAGGTILLRRRALRRIGGIGAVRAALIDDVALARAVKRGGRIWLGHSALARSERRYPGFADIWQMIARTAYVQLGFSPLLLAGTVAAMGVVWLVPPLATLAGEGGARVVGLLAWAAMAWSYLPSLRRFGLSGVWAPLLPLVAAFYLAATLGSAWNHYSGRGVAWKGRAYRGSGA
ncbi:MAG: glycosyltransferase [Rhodospirillales bacterium]|jgi:hopene-associated glycosyltransferase HpnB|nr:glycosyltransferase [Rhodospirillales bacterium]